jgi:Replication factor A protein 3
MSLHTPRILPSHLHAFAPSAHPTISTVRLLGKLTSLHGDQAVLESCNNETVTLILNR